MWTTMETNRYQSWFGGDPDLDEGTPIGDRAAPTSTPRGAAEMMIEAPLIEENEMMKVLWQVLKVNS